MLARDRAEMFRRRGGARNNQVRSTPQPGLNLAPAGKDDEK